MNKDILDKIINDVKSNPYIEWKNRLFISKVVNNNEFKSYLFNEDGNHGYFAFLNKLVNSVDGIVVEVGNREGLGLLSMYNGLKENQLLYSIDIVDDLRFIPEIIINDSRVNILNNFNSLDKNRIAKEFKPKSISLIFFDTVHTYEQIFEEYNCWEPYLKDDCVILIDDIQNIQSDRTKWKFHEEFNCNVKYDITEWAHNRTGFGVYLKI